jgi:hypothetical protein
VDSRILPDDLAQIGLADHLARTERALRAELRKIDSKADCEVVAAADLGVPYDVLRLAGGFATGCFVQWECSTPVVPIVITMNIDTSSIFWVDESASFSFTASDIVAARTKVEEQTGYLWNFDESNHFISLVREEPSGRLAIIIHSNEREFKNQYHGLYPTEGNWFANEVRTSEDGRVRLLVGRPAELFASMAKMLEPYNIVRHQFVLNELLASSGRVEDELHHQHYYMPTSSSAALGCYVVASGEPVPIFSQPGAPILMYAGLPNGPNTVRVNGQDLCLIAHGYGMALNEPLNLEIRRDELTFQGRRYPRRSGISLLDHPSVVMREFVSEGAFLDVIALPCPGRVVGKFRQLRSLTRFGFREHAKVSATPV